MRSLLAEAEREDTPVLAQGLRLRRSAYVFSVEVSAGEEISNQTATRDLAALVDEGLLVPHGERRARYYSAAEELRQAWQEIRATRPPRSDEDSFDTPAEQLGLV